MSNAKPFLGEYTTFTGAYPNFSELTLRVQHRGDLAYPHQKAEVYTVSNLPRVLPCANPRCQQGGYDLTATIITLEGGRIANYKVSWHCNGHEGSPKGRRKGSACMNSVELEFEAKYKP